MTEVRAAFNEQWFGKASVDVLRSLVHQVRNVEGVVVEIGSWEGRSTCAGANAAWPRPYHAVDTWLGSPGEISAELAAERDVFAQFTANVAALTRGNVVVHRMGWREFVATLTEPVALVFIDAEHTYREVYDTIAAFRPLMAPLGMICGDDVHHPPIQTAVTDHFSAEEVQVGATMWWYRC